MKKHLKIIENNKAPNLVRFANFIIDRIVIFAIFFLFATFAVAMYNLFEIEFFINITDWLSQINRFEDILITTCIYLLYLFLMEYLTKGRTIGKYITGTKVISIDGSNPTFKEYLIRTISRIVPFEAFSFFGNAGWHDDWSNTRVITIKNYKAEIQAKSEIESLGNKEIT